MENKVIVVKSTDNNERPLLSISGGVDSGYVIEGIFYHDSKTSIESEYNYPGNPDDFIIGRSHFIKRNFVWFYRSIDNEEKEVFEEVVYGQHTLEEYGSGKMFENLTRMFGGD